MKVEVVCLIDRLDLADLGVSLNRMGKIVLSADRAHRSHSLKRAIDVGAAKVEPVNRQQPPPNYRKLHQVPANKRNVIPDKGKETIVYLESDFTPLVDLLQGIFQELSLLRKSIEAQPQPQNIDPQALVDAIKVGLSGIVVKSNGTSQFEGEGEETFIPTGLVSNSDLSADITLSSKVSDDTNLDEISAALKAMRKE